MLQQIAAQPVSARVAVAPTREKCARSSRQYRESRHSSSSSSREAHGSCESKTCSSPGSVREATASACTAPWSTAGSTRSANAQASSCRGASSVKMAPPGKPTQPNKGNLAANPNRPGNQPANAQPPQPAAAATPPERPADLMLSATPRARTLPTILPQTGLRTVRMTIARHQTGLSRIGLTPTGQRPINLSLTDRMRTAIRRTNRSPIVRMQIVQRQIVRSRIGLTPTGQLPINRNQTVQMRTAIRRTNRSPIVRTTIISPQTGPAESARCQPACARSTGTKPSRCEPECAG